MAKPILDDPPLPRDPDRPGPAPTIAGPIGTRWRQLGGEAWGRPGEFGVISLGDGRGRWAQFMARDLSLRVIVWTSQTGARVIFGEFNNKWAGLGSERSVLGYPTSDALVTHDGVGRFQTFERGILVWRPETGVHEVHGAIVTRYGQLGGSVYGYPLTDETSTPDGRGRFNHFRELPGGHDKSIYWTAETGAHEIYGLIRGRWAALGWEGSVLGYPTSGEQKAHDGVGRFQTFEGGIIVWHPTTGAFEVHGAILKRYLQLGGTVWGYPTTDESNAKGPGRFNHFVHLPSGQERSIYWTPDTGAIEVYGALHQHWKQLGWEGSHLGYPVSPEAAWPEGGTGARQQRFQGGRILYSRRGAHWVTGADPTLWKQTINATGVRGEVEISLPYNGHAHFGGYVRAVKQDSYDFLVNAIAKTSTNLAVAFYEKGKIHGDFEPGPERFNFNQTSAHAIPATAFWDLQQGTLQVEKNYRSHLTGAIGDLFEAALKWFAGAALIATPGTALLLLGGTTAVTGLAGGSLASGARIVGGTLWLAGPFGTAIALAADAIARLASKERPLSQAEYDLAKLVFKNSLPSRQDIVVTDAIGGNNRPFTYPRFDGKMVLSVGEKYYNDLRYYGVAEHKKVFGQLLIHELVHVWQYHNNAANISYVADAIWARIRDDYEPGEVLDEPWDWFGLEEQGAIVEDWFTDNYNGPGSVANTGTAADDFGLASPTAVGHKAFKFITANIRAGRN